VTTRRRQSALSFTTFCFRTLLIAILTFAGLSQLALAQQTLGSINGTVTDSSGAVVQNASIKARATATNLEVTATSNADGSFSIADLPIGSYQVTFTKDGFQTAVYPQIVVQGNRTATVNAKLKPGAISSTVTVEGTPLLNQTDTTTGYTLNELQIAETPLGTGSFTQLAVLSPGVSADLLNTAGSNAGLGNQAIWANGQRDTSNSFTVNGIYANNIFNGKSTSQVTSGRVAVNIGQNGNGNNPSGEIVTSTSVYGAIGQALPSPPPETIQEMHVNSAMYDASQGANSGAQIELTTKSGTNSLHGGAYEYHQQTGWNANEWFFNFNGLPRPQMHRNVFGGFIGGPIKKDKLFFFASYQGQRVSDQLLATSFVAVPPDLTDSGRDATSLAAMANKDFSAPGCGTGTNPPCLNIQPSQITSQALALLNQKAPGGGFFIPSASPNFMTFQQVNRADTFIQGPNSQFTADQVNGNVDYNFGAKDRLAGKYYFQRDPNVTPFAESELLGFPQRMKAGGQVLSIDNTTALTPNASWNQRLGFIRQIAYSNTSQFLKPTDAGISLPGLSLFPTISIHNADNSPFSTDSLSIGPVDNFANAGIFQNNFEAASSFKWIHGRHSFATGFNFEDTQLNVINKNNDVARITFEDFPGFLTGSICSPNAGDTFCGNQDVSEILAGASNRHFIAKQFGAYAQDDIRISSRLTLDLGVRWDWDGPLYERNGLLTNFYPQNYSYDAASDTINNIGLVVAGNNKAFGTKGVSNSTLTGRQWGFAPRIGLAYSPSFVRNVVVRAGFGMYYDRGEYFTEFSPPAGGGISGPFGVTVEEPFVVPFFAVPNATFAQPFGTAPPPPPPSNLSTVQALVPNATNLTNQTTPYCNSLGESFCSPLFFGGYDPKNTLPYSENWTLDFQWQPKNDLVLTLGFVGNHGVHELIPVPFNQARIATAQNPTLAGGPNVQTLSYGTQVSGVNAESVCTLAVGFCAGNVDLRVPYIGYDPNSDFNRAIGISNYSALQFNVTKRVSHGLMISGSYTFSHTLDEQSGLGLFYNGNDPNNPRSSYGNSDFDRKHVITVSYVYQLPSLATAHGWRKQVVNGWGIGGITVLQSGQPYSVIDFSGGAASIYWGDGQDFITNPIVPVGGFGATATNPILQGTTGINAQKPVLNAAAFGIPAPYAPGTNGVPACDNSTGTPVCDNFENGYASGGRNIFRGPFQERWDIGLFKNFNINDKVQLKYDLKAFNVFNHPSFDIPSNNVEFNPGFCYPPSQNFNCFGSPGFVPGYSFPPFGNLGQLQHTIGSPRFIQMALHLTF
jgi:Carboxypeptidase regulatory-like domain/TonB dependent receptor